MKRMILFDMDDTLAESKCSIDDEMADLLNRLLDRYMVGVISGGRYEQFQKQLLANLSIDSQKLSRFFLFPTCATAFYRYAQGDWERVYEETLTPEEKERIFSAFATILKDHKPQQVWGELLEDRNTQVTLSALGQQAPPEAKKVWDPDKAKRLSWRAQLLSQIPDFDVRIGGGTSLDVTRKGIDKAYGIGKIEEILSITKEEMLFIGDALEPGGNDYPVKSCGVECIETTGPSKTKEIIRKLLD